MTSRNRDDEWTLLGAGPTVVTTRFPSRRSAVRTLERSGVPRSTAMAMVGHKTESIDLSPLRHRGRSDAQGGGGKAGRVGERAEARPRSKAPDR